MAIFAISLSNTYGQVTCPVPRIVDPICLPNDALHPIAGQPYNYTVVVPTPPGTKAYTWFVTQDPAFITAGVLTPNRETVPGLHIAATGVGYNDPATGQPTLSITWKNFVPDPLLPVFVVINVQNTASTPDLCVSQNTKVFKIMPINAFTLDIANVNLAGVVSAYESPIDRCIHDIVSATYVDATPGPEGVSYDFGVDYLYYVVTAANFSVSWRPSIMLAGVDAQETILAVEWTRPTDFAFATPNAMPLAAGVYTATNPVTVLDPSGTVGPAGECILIRVTIDHTVPPLIYQGLADEIITTAVDGVTELALPTPVADVHWSSTLPVVNTFCGLPDGFQFDLAVQTIKPRPDITAPAMPAPGFLPVQP